MKLTKHTLTPPVTFAGLRNEVDQMMDRFLRPDAFLGLEPLTGDMWSPSLDFSETEKDYVVRLEAPGVAKEDIEVNLEGQTLLVRGERISTKERTDEKFFWREREEGRFLRSIRLPTAVEEGKVNASVNNGIVTIRLPKKEPSASTRIEVK